MLYNPPLGATDPNAAYIQGNAALGIQGSHPPAIGFEGAQREIVNAIAAAGLTPSNTDMTQLAQAIGKGSIYFASDATNTNAYSATLVPAITTWTNGMTIDLTVAHANTGAASFGGVSILRADGSALASGDIAAPPYHARVIFDFAANKLLLQNPATLMAFKILPSSATTFYVNGSTGNDSNPGTSALPFATLQGAVAYISQFQSASGVTVNVAAGTYAGVKVTSSFISSWNFVGAGVGSCTINGTSTAGSQQRAVIVMSGATATFSGFTFNSNYENVNVQPSANVTLNNCNCTPPGISTSSALGSYGYLRLTGTINFANGTYGEFLLSIQGSQIACGYHDNVISLPVTLNFGTSTVTVGAVSAQQDGTIAFDPTTVTMSGTVTGPRFNAIYGGSIGTNGSGLNYLPGSSAGNAPTGYYF